ncbi:E3 ubiquitin-protein ligase TRIM35-like [Alosa pseudoharengus]|uniref:E3 ubiquitin-protein ligase TRIM35-like n=1 Tax=Alosa pseudoharengus TaxID=34774 RepID=UPI003F893EF7
MAYKRSLSEEDLTCPVCCDIFMDPVILSCSHTICKACIDTFWTVKPSKQCPICRGRSLMNPPPSNLALKNLCESFVQERASEASLASEELCMAHSERIKLFCLEDREPICLVCWTSTKHRRHKCCPTEEAASDYREQLKTTLNSLEERLNGLNNLKRDCNHIATHIKCQAYNTRQHIQKEFEMLHQFLQKEEEARMAALEEEAGQKSSAISAITESISATISTLSDTIRAIEEAVGLADVPLLQNVKSTIERVQCMPKDPDNPTGSLIDVAQHVGNLKFRVWEKMQDIVVYTPVVLDPNTSQAKLRLCEDLTSVLNSAEKLRVPYNPERFDYYPCVLGSRSLTAGVHCWDVEVGDSTLWSVGVTAVSNHRKGDAFFNGDTWHVRYLNGEYTGHSPAENRGPLVAESLRVLRVRLDLDGGEVSFSEPLAENSLCSFRHVFTEGVLPFLYNYCMVSPLRIVTVKNSEHKS